MYPSFHWTLTSDSHGLSPASTGLPSLFGAAGERSPVEQGAPGGRRWPGWWNPRWRSSISS